MKITKKQAATATLTLVNGAPLAGSIVVRERVLAPSYAPVGGELRPLSVDGMTDHPRTGVAVAVRAWSPPS